MQNMSDEQYLLNKQVPHLLDDLLQDMLEARPTDATDYCLEWLKCRKETTLGTGLTALICGGGNGAHAYAGVMAARGVKVHVYTPFENEVEGWNKGGLSITCHYTDGSTVVGKPALVTSDPKAAAEGVDFAIVVLPTFVHENSLKAVGPHLKEGAWIGTIEGAWWGRPPLGEDWVNKVVFYGIRTLPWAARIKEYGKSVDILGTKDFVECACSPVAKCPELSATLERAIGVKFPASGSLLGLFALDAGNIIHPGVMYGRLHDWDGTPFEEAPLFYQGIDDRIAEIMIEMDNEAIGLCKEIKKRYPAVDLHAVVPTLQWLQESYTEQIKDKSSFKSSFNTNAAYEGLRFPMKDAPEQPGKLVPNWDYRYLTADVPYGIVVIRGIAELAGYATPMLDKVITWAQGVLEKEWLVDGKLAGKDLASSRAPQKFGIHNLDAFMESAML